MSINDESNDKNEGTKNVNNIIENLYCTQLRIDDVLNEMNEIVFHSINVE